MLVKDNLPGLESVRFSNYGNVSFKHSCFLNALLLLFQLFLGIFALLGAFAIPLPKHSHSSFSPVFALMMPIAIIIFIWAIRTALSDFYWETSNDGISAQGWFRRRFIRWSDIRIVTSGKGTITSCYRVNSLRDRLKIYFYENSNILNFIVSMWQHLRAHGKEDYLQLPKEALTFWKKIPEDIPYEQEWVNPRPPRFGPLHFAAVVAIPLLIIALYNVIPDKEHHIWALGMILVILSLNFYSLSIRPILTIARSISVHKDGIKIEIARKTAFISWPEINNINYMQSEMIVIASTSLKNVMIPSSGDLEPVLLAIIRSLRERDKPLYIPIPRIAKFMDILQR